MNAGFDLKNCFENIQNLLNFLEIDKLPSDVNIDPPTLESLQACLDLQTESVTERYKKAEAKL